MFHTCPMLADIAPLLAHQGGWDELAMVILPVALVASLLIVANRRAKAQLSARQADQLDRAAAPQTDPPTPGEPPLAHP